MILATVFLLMAAHPAQAANTAEYSKGSFMFQACEAVARPHPSGPYLRESTYCLSYIEGFIDGRDTAGKGFCAGAASYGEIAGAYVAWMKNHPEMMNTDKRTGMWLALAASYPCSPEQR